MLFYILIIIIVIIIFIPTKPKNKEHYQVFDIKRDILSRTSDLAKYLILK